MEKGSGVHKLPEKLDHATENGSLEHSKIKLDCSHIDDPVEGNNELIYGGWIVLGARETITTLSLNMHKAENDCPAPWITGKK